MSRIQGKTTSPQLPTAQVYVGIDVSKSHLDVYLHPTGVSRRVANDKAGLQILARFLRSLRAAPDRSGSNGPIPPACA